MYSFSLKTLLAHSWLKFCRNTLTDYTDDRRFSLAPIRETVTVPDGTIQRDRPAIVLLRVLSPLTEAAPGRTHILYLRHETARPCDSADCLCMRDPGSGLVDPTSWTLASWLCAYPGPHVEKQQGLGTQKGPRTQPVPCSWAFQSSVPGARCQGLVFQTRAQLPRAHEDPTTSGEGRGRGAEALEAQSVPY